MTGSVRSGFARWTSLGTSPMLRPMPRSPRLLALLFVASIVAVPAVFPTRAAAQMTQGPPTPMVTDLSKITVGSWAKYNMTMGTMPPMTMKMAQCGFPAPDENHLRPLMA